MQYSAGILSGISASTLFWLIDKYLLTLPQNYQVWGALACFITFGATGYWLASRASKKSEGRAGTRVASGLSGRNIKVTVDGVTTTGKGSADIVSDIDADNIEVDAKDIKTDG